MTRFRSALIGTGALALVAATLAPLSADHAGAAPGAASGVAAQATSTPTAEEIAALDQAAAKSGEMPWAVEFSYAVDRVKEAFPDDFGAAEVHADQASGWIAFEGAIPGDAREVVANLPGVELRGDLGMSEKDISTAVDLIFNSLLQTHGSDFYIAVVPMPGTMRSSSSTHSRRRRVRPQTASKSRCGLPRRRSSSADSPFVPKLSTRA